MDEYSKLINGIVGAILQKEVQGLKKQISSQELNKRNNSLQLAINREFEFVQSILENCDISKASKTALTKKFFKLYALEAKNGKSLSAKLIKEIRKKIIDEIENCEIATLARKEKMQKVKDAKKMQFEKQIDSLMNEIDNVQIKENTKKIVGVTTINKIQNAQVLNSKKKLNRKIVASENINTKQKISTEETSLIIKEDNFMNKIRRMGIEFSKKMKSLFENSKNEKKELQPVNNISLLSKNSTSANAFIKRVYVDMKKVNKLANANYALGESSKE